MIAVVVPSNRKEKLKDFSNKWSALFTKHLVMLYIVEDGVNPHLKRVEYDKVGTYMLEEYSVVDIMGEYQDLIYNFNDGVRNLGFAAAYKDGAEIIVSLDDDTEPDGDTIERHIEALNLRTELSWMNTTVSDVYMRGFPYGIREEAEVVLSHGLWKGVCDLDASTQLLNPNFEPSPETYSTYNTIPKGVLFPMCIMNVAFKRKATPYMYQAPMFGEINRFADIWGGIEAKKDFDREGWGVINGYATVLHKRASDPFVNLMKEAKGIGMNEKYGEGEYFELFFKQRKRWQEFLSKYD